jgi:hypothetical protein
LIPERVLQTIRNNQLRFMPQRAIIRRWVGIGGGERDRMVIAEDLQARFTAGAGRFGDVADRLQGITPFTITVPYDTDVLPGDEIVDEESRTFQVRAVHKPKSYLTAIQMLADQVND